MLLSAFGFVLVGGADQKLLETSMFLDMQVIGMRSNVTKMFGMKQMHSVSPLVTLLSTGNSSGTTSKSTIGHTSLGKLSQEILHGTDSPTPGQDATTLETVTLSSGGTLKVITKYLTPTTQLTH